MPAIFQKQQLTLSLDQMSKSITMLNNAAFPDLLAHFWTVTVISGKWYFLFIHFDWAKLKSIPSRNFVAERDWPENLCRKKQSQLATKFFGLEKILYTFIVIFFGTMQHCLFLSILDNAIKWVSILVSPPAAKFLYYIFFCSKDKKRVLLNAWERIEERTLQPFVAAILREVKHWDAFRQLVLEMKFQAAWKYNIRRRRHQFMQLF